MKKHKALEKIIKKVGSLTKTARVLGISNSYLCHLKEPERNIPIKYVKKLIELSDGEVTKEDLRPDVYD